jgi:ubiquinone/menaquinone biosynthesis C-methylase UbiE
MKNSLSKNLIFIFLLLTVLLNFPGAVWVQQKEGFVEAWELRHNLLQPPVKIMDTIGLKPGMVIGDIGAGRGRFTVWFADRVGDKGKVYANDILERSLRHLEQRCERLGFTNVITCLGTVVEPNIPDKVLDIAFMINVYHHLEKPVELLKNIVPTLKPDGILVIVEHEPEKSGYATESTSEEELVKQAAEAGYKLERIETFLARDNIYFLKKK